MSNLIAVEVIAGKILEIRGKKVILDKDLAELYEVETKYLLRQVKRNFQRFPEDFMLRLSKNEFLRCQNVTSKRGGRRYLPYAFTEQGVAMLSSVLNSERAILVNIQIMRAFTDLRRMFISNRELKRKIEEMEKRYDRQFLIVFQAIRQLLEPPKQTRAVGFRID